MTYDEWKDYIAHNQDSQYWSRVEEFAQQITHQLTEYKQHVVAKQLGLNGPQLSTLAPLIKAIAERQAND